MGKKTKVGKTRKDKFYQLAKETGFRSRAAFKLIQLNRKFGFLQQSQVCIDLCAAPGGWMQVAKQNMPVSSIVIGVDLFPIRPIAGCISLVEDITTEKCRQSLTKELQSWKADVVLHDGAPNVGRNWLYDAYQQICLTLNALKLGTQFLRKGGYFVTKVFRSKDYNALLWVLKQLFKKVHATKPSASRKESAEIFVVCQGYMAPNSIDPRLLDAKYVFEELDLENKKKSSLLHPEKRKRIKAEGYTEEDISLRNSMAASTFMQADNALAALQGIASITIDDERIRKHKKTTVEILECCKDLKVLGRKDIKGLLLWWKVVREDLYKTKLDAVIEEPEEVAPKPLTQEEIEDMEDTELQHEIENLADEEQKELKRKRKKTLKSKAKLHEKMNLNMVIKGDEGPVEEIEHELFELSDISTTKDLVGMLDVNPDHVVENEIQEQPKLSKYIKYDKDDKRMDDDANYENDDEPEMSADEESDVDYDRDGLCLSDNDNTQCSVKDKKKTRNNHPLIRSGDFRDKDTKRQQRVQLWYEKDNLQNIESDDDEENHDIESLAKGYEAKGVSVLGVNTDHSSNILLGKKAKRRARHEAQKEEISESSDSDEEIESDELKVDGNVTKEPKPKKIRLNEQELALGALLIRGKKTRRDLIDAAWNRYAFNDDHLPAWFVQDEQEHMQKPQPVPKELQEEYQRKVQELNVRPIKKVMEAKARKKRRTVKRLAKAKKMAEKVMENANATSQEKVNQLKKIYKKAQEKKKEITYVVAKKHTASRRARRPAGVKGRYRVVDPREKKDKRSKDAKKRRESKKR
ncbi:pre-rRNA 2'-O-ribose RNA methyltransferase FTSJ3 [Scaptodrosophila lebanonensis]|uniref:Putative rRNA methyltransferase n=1 Tax=Drosophila lebanonensis TaxID=7225 RepID=A0A6J2U0H1_DROLE|nr:pre-rRNA 2'-O-ribose RNA methyltransferase FTSJ3 [Scaptodrosophila lebanonensis]XP_030381396.1 pre-rRNA 2'-O-ribose RNA methyltransferase FTSJ3 [Scaptodrosophila lebanonensis]